MTENVLSVTGGTYTFTFDNGFTAVDSFTGASSKSTTEVSHNQTILADVTMTGSIRAATTQNAAAVINNTVRIDSGTYSRSNPLTANTGIYAAFTERSADGARVEGNRVILNGGTFTDEDIAAAKTEGDLTATNNVVEINGGTFLSPKGRSSVYGVYAENVTGSVNGSGVIINGGSFEDDVDVYAVYDTAKDSTDDVFIEINATSEMNLRNVTLYGSATEKVGRITIRNPSGLALGGIHKINVLQLEAVPWNPSTPAIALEYDAGFSTIELSPTNGFTLTEDGRIRPADDDHVGFSNERRRSGVLLHRFLFGEALRRARLVERRRHGLADRFRRDRRTAHRFNARRLRRHHRLGERIDRKRTDARGFDVFRHLDVADRVRIKRHLDGHVAVAGGNGFDIRARRHRRDDPGSGTKAAHARGKESLRRKALHTDDLNLHLVGSGKTVGRENFDRWRNLPARGPFGREVSLRPENPHRAASMRRILGARTISIHEEISLSPCQNSKGIHANAKRIRPENPCAPGNSARFR